MTHLYQWLCIVLLAISSPCVVAQTAYGSIEKGMVLSGGIGLGLFVKPLPLPPGDWLVVSKTTSDIGLTSSAKAFRFRWQK